MSDTSDQQQPESENPEAAAPETTGSAEPDAAQLAAEIADLKDKLLRAMAETENVRRRAERERGDAARYGAASFARDMLPVADSLQRALAVLDAETRGQLPEMVRQMIDGVEVTERALIAAFERHQIRVIAPQPGEKFDPNLHEAMFEVPNTGQPNGTIVQRLEAGYMIGERLLRAARVGVATGGTDGGSGSGSRIDTTA